MAREGLNLTAARSSGANRRRAENTQPVNTSPADPEDEDSEGEEDDGSDILSNVPQRGQNKNNMLYIVVGVIAAVALIAFFILFMGGRNRGREDPAPTTQTEQEQPVQQEQQPATQTEVDTGQPQGVGTQDFTQNTTMSNSDVLTNPDQYMQDLYGLSTRVDYTVDKISYVADFVSYTKHRGTWGGGLELYWLDAEYKGNKYVVQVPFKYYKELDDTGIVPVKMEVLSIQGSAQGETLTVISYMALDEEVLKDILKNQAKGS